MTLLILAGLIAGYFIGSIPFGLVLTRLAGLGDIRAIGSGNIGATNVLRTGNKPLAALTLICDSGKGTAAVCLASLIAPPAAFAAALGSVLGHMFPIWLRFKGGKGVATTLGTLLALAPVVGVCACLTWLATALISRISSLSALVCMAAAPIFAYVFYTPTHALLVALIAILVFIKHHTNIARLIKGEEPRINVSKKA